MLYLQAPCSSQTYVVLSPAWSDPVCGGCVHFQLLAGSEAGVELSDQLQDTLGFVGNKLELSEARRDKWLMGERCVLARSVVISSGLRSGSPDSRFCAIV